MLGAWTMAKPGAQPLVDLTLVNAWIAAAQILTHHPHARVEQVERVAAPSTCTGAAVSKHWSASSGPRQRRCDWPEAAQASLQSWR
jgi:hypothetical protein